MPITSPVLGVRAKLRPGLNEVDFFNESEREFYPFNAPLYLPEGHSVLFAPKYLLDETDVHPSAYVVIDDYNGNLALDAQKREKVRRQSQLLTPFNNLVHEELRRPHKAPLRFDLQNYLGMLNGDSEFNRRALLRLFSIAGSDGQLAVLKELRNLRPTYSSKEAVFRKSCELVDIFIEREKLQPPCDFSSSLPAVNTDSCYLAWAHPSGEVATLRSLMAGKLLEKSAACFKKAIADKNVLYSELCHEYASMAIDVEGSNRNNILFKGLGVFSGGVPEYSESLVETALSLEFYLKREHFLASIHSLASQIKQMSSPSP